MKRPVRILIALIVVLLAGTLTSPAQDEIKGKEEKKIIEAISGNYRNWSRASWSGRLSTDFLPVSATLKVYMEKGKLTLLSVRAPFLGEVVRIEADADSVLIVNKMKRCYYSRPVARLSQMAPDLTEDLQALLLGRMFVVGSGQLSHRCADKTEIYPTATDSCYMVVPEVPSYLPDVIYGFATDAELRMATFVAAYGRQAVETDPADETDPGFTYEPRLQVQAEIRYNGSGATADLKGMYAGKEYGATLTTSGIEWGGKGFDRINIDGFRRVSLRQVIRF